MIKKKYYILIPVLLLFLDQLTKYWARNSLRGTVSDGIVGVKWLIKDVLSFCYVENRGAVWGVLQGKYSLLALFTVVVVLGLIYVLMKIPSGKKYTFLQLILLFILSGAIGNLFDRVYFGFVTDFISIDLINFPVFNLADIYVTVSAFALVLLFCFYYKEDDLDFFPFFGSGKKDKVENDEEK